MSVESLLDEFIIEVQENSKEHFIVVLYRNLLLKCVKEAVRKEYTPNKFICLIREYGQLWDNIAKDLKYIKRGSFTQLVKKDLQNKKLEKKIPDSFKKAIKFL